MSSIGASTTHSSIRSRSGAIRCSACPASSTSIAPAASPSSTRPAPASPTTSRSTPTCPTSSSSTRAGAPILKNVPTYVCRKPDDLAYVLEHLSELVVKQVHGSGGYGMLVGPAATRDEIDMFRMLVKARPDRYIAQPTLALSTCPTLVEKGIAERHVDLRPVRAGRRPRAADAGRPHARRAARGLPGRQLQPGRRHQRHLGAAGVDDARAHRQRSVLDVALHRARREHRAPAGGRLSHRAAAARGPRPGRGMALDAAQRRLRQGLSGQVRRLRHAATSSTSCCSTPTTPRASIPALPPPGATRGRSAPP